MDNWINNDVVFHKQLAYNLEEIATIANYPKHWFIFIDFVNQFQPRNILDIGCGCGVYYELCKRHLDVAYTGIDHSKHAIELAKETWNYDNFFIKGYKELTAEYVKQFDLIHAGAMLDILPNGDEALRFILSLSPKEFLIARVKLTDKPSYHETFTAYDGAITSYEFYHNEKNFFKLCSEHYDIHQVSDPKCGSNFYLKNKKK